LQQMYPTFKAWRSKFKSVLAERYDDREAENVFYFVLDVEYDISRTQSFMRLEEAVSDAMDKRLTKILEDLRSGPPVQYVLGKALFFDNIYHVNEGVLIPRPETEELVQWILEENKKELRALDIGCGSGCIGIELARNRKDWSVQGLDVSEQALKLARKNAQGISNIRFVIEDIRTTTKQMDFDIVVSNPPYVPYAEKENMIRRVTAYEPDLALYVDDADPLLFYRRIMELMQQKGKAGARLYFEIHESFKSELETLVSLYLWSDVEFKRDLQGKWRMLRCVV
jgi:release factor glutamine methyltransferase